MVEIALLCIPGELRTKYDMGGGIFTQDLLDLLHEEATIVSSPTSKETSHESRGNKGDMVAALA